MKTALLPSIVALGLVLVACSGGSGGGTGGATTTEDGYCTTKFERAQRCAGDGGSTITDNRSLCGSEYRCKVQILANPDSYFACRTNAECSSANEARNKACTTQSAGGATRPESDTCAKKYAACKNAGGKSFDNDTCPELNALRTDVLSKVMPCFEKACNEVGDCVEATLNAAAPDCN
jgi:hypothetical protein